MFNATSRLLGRDSQAVRLPGKAGSATARFTREAVIDARLRIVEVPREQDEPDGFGRQIRVGATLREALGDLDPDLVAGLAAAIDQKRPAAGFAVSSSRLLCPSDTS